MATPSAPCLVLENLSKEFGGLRAVDNISLSIPPGQRHALIGPNGAGKTTLFNLVSQAGGERARHGHRAVRRRSNSSAKKPRS